MWHRFFVSFHSTLEVRCSMFDVHLSKQSFLIILLQSSPAEDMLYSVVCGDWVKSTTNYELRIDVSNY